MIDQLILGNHRFRETEFSENIERYKQVMAGQSPKVLWLGCSDSRVSPERITNAMPGEIFVQRNIGNIVPLHDWNFATVLEYAIKHLKVEEIVICGHSDCGAVKSLDKELDDAYIPLWLNNARDAKTRVDRTITPPKTPDEMKSRSAQIEKENIRLQIEHLKTYPLVKQALDKGAISIYGVYYDIHTGALTKVT